MPTKKQFEENQKRLLQRALDQGISTAPTGIRPTNIRRQEILDKLDKPRRAAESTGQSQTGAVEVTNRPTVKQTPGDIFGPGMTAPTGVATPGRVAPTVPTPASPVVDIPLGTSPQGDDFMPRSPGELDAVTEVFRKMDTGTSKNSVLWEKPDLSKPVDQDRQRMVEIGIKQATGQPLTEDEVRFLIEQQITAGTQAPDLTPIQEAVSGQISDTATRISDREKEQRAKREELLDERKALTEEQVREQQELIQKGADLEIQAGQSTLAFKGFGRSTLASQNAQSIQSAANRQILATQQAGDLQDELFLKELQGADEAELQPMREQLNALYTQSEQLKVEQAVLVAEANSQAGVTGLEAIQNVMQVLPQSEQSSVDTGVSELVGYISDAYGNPIITGPDGNPVPIQGGGTKYEMYQDSYTGQVMFYNPNDPSDFFTGPGGVTSYENPFTGSISSSNTSDSSGMFDATSLVQDLYPDSTQYGGNCALFAAQIVPNMPYGASTPEGRLAGINYAKENGFGGTDMSFVQVGDVIHTTEGDATVGHSAVVAGIEGDNLILLEANWKPGQITYGRTINKNDGAILGWVRDNGTGVREQPGSYTPTVKNEGENLAIEDMIQGNYNFSPLEVNQFEKGTPPVFTGRSQYEKDQKAEEWQKKYNLYWSLRNSGQFDIEKYAPQEYQRLSQDFVKTSEAQTVQKYADLQQTLRTYYDLVDEFGQQFIPTAGKKKQLENAYANLKSAWKEAANLGALTGPDLGLIEDAIPNAVVSLYGDDDSVSAFNAFFTQSKRSILQTIQQESERVMRQAGMRINTLKSTYGNLYGSAVFDQYENMAGTTVLTVPSEDIDELSNLTQ